LLDERGQGSIEFIFVTLIALLVIGGLVNLVGSETTQSQTGDLAQARMTGEKMAEIINTVYINGAGYSISLTVPDNMVVYVNNPTGFLTINSITTGNNISVKLIPKNVPVTTLNSGSIYQVTYNSTGNITFNLM
jgi:uncharacterized protein (UPF0333 family)